MIKFDLAHPGLRKLIVFSVLFAEKYFDVKNAFNKLNLKGIEQRDICPHR